MDAQATAPFLRHFRDLRDPRRHNVRHVFTDILTIAILAVLCKADDWDEVVVWANARVAWLRTILTLPNGVPSVDTFARVFARVDPGAFERCFMAWTASLAKALGGAKSGATADATADVVALDGKLHAVALRVRPGSPGFARFAQAASVGRTRTLYIIGTTARERFHPCKPLA